MSSPSSDPISRLGRSFLWAGRGFWRCLWRERNLRVHLCAAALALWLGARLGAGRLEWAVLLLCCGLVLAAELLNSALEAAADLFAPGYHPLAGLAKDMAAAGVLCAAVFAGAAGLAVLWRPAELLELGRGLLASPGRLCLLLALGLLALAFILLPGEKKPHPPKPQERNRPQ